MLTIDYIKIIFSQNLDVLTLEWRDYSIYSVEIFRYKNWGKYIPPTIPHQTQTHILLRPAMEAIKMNK